MTGRPFHALTLTSNGLLRALTSDCHACAAHESPASFKQFTAIWDTGATASVITQHVVDVCSLKPTGMTKVHGVHGVRDAETFLINIGLPNRVAFGNVDVTLGELAGAEMLIGMDIITSGDFSITNVGGQTVFSFRTPSIKTIDYVQAANKQRKQPGPTPRRVRKRR